MTQKWLFYKAFSRGLPELYHAPEVALVCVTRDADEEHVADPVTRLAWGAGAGYLTRRYAAVAELVDAPA